MDCSETRLDTIELQMSSSVSRDNQSVPVATNVSLDTRSVPELLTNLRLSDLYNLPGESVAMNAEIFSAMRAGNIEFWEKMKSYETPMTCFKNDNGDTILHVAASFDHVGLVKSIVSECPSLLLEPNWKGRIPLHVAARAGRSEVVKILAAPITYFPARLDEDRERLNLCVVQDINGDTPLHLAMKDFEEKTELLQKDCNRWEFMYHVMMYLECSSMTKYFSDEWETLTKTASWLVNANRCVPFLANEEGISPLYLAVKAGNLALVKAILSHPFNRVQGELPKLTSQLKGRKSLVHVALKAKNADVLDVILNEDPNLVNERDEEGQTCISVGAYVGFCKGIHKVLKLSTSGVFECDKDGSFPIHIAVEKSHMYVVRELLKCCPGSVELLNRKGQNIIHIAAKSGNALFFLKRYIKKFRKERLKEEQDVDGNTPLHLATLNWRPRSVNNIVGLISTNTLDVQNKEGWRPLDIAQMNLQPDYIFRERMTLMVLLCAYKPRGVYWIPTSGMTLRSISKKKVGDKKSKDQQYEELKDKQYDRFKDRVNVLLVIAALVATMTFAAGFTMPGGFNSSAPNMGMAILADNKILSGFLVCDTLAMQFSLLAIVALVWAQLGDQKLAHKAFHLALPSLFFALCCMSYAFLFGVLTTTEINKSLTNKIGFITVVLTALTASLLSPYVIPQLHGIPFFETFCRNYLNHLLLFVDEEDSEKLYTSNSDHSDFGILQKIIFLIKDRWFL